MNPEYHIYEQIDLYLKGKLQGAELEAFEKKLASDPAVQKMVEVQRIANKVIVTKQLAGLKAQMAKDLANDPPAGTSAKNIILLSSLAVLISGAVFFFVNKKEDKKVISENIQKENNNNIPEENDINTESVIKPEKKKIPKTYSEIIAQDTDKVTATTLPKEEEQKILEEIREENPNIDTTPVTKINKCDGITMKVPLDVKEACRDVNDGSITIRFENIEGGQGPYKFSIDKGEKYTKNYIFRNLEKGIYPILVKDSEGCEKIVIGEVKEKICHPPIDEVFNPNSASWKIPTDDNAAITVQIFNKNQILVYSKDFSESSMKEWDGKDNNGGTLEQGLYAIIITHKDGSIQKGYISIMY
ncbi:MAG: gliding motility-associated C-terminal domain-containing protein [Cytophagaceae bacterium]|nr:gliding motility-associated C-terminal domain-containing protein [Cytophagaceae bacterium]